MCCHIEVKTEKTPVKLAFFTINYRNFSIVEIIIPECNAMHHSRILNYKYYHLIGTVMFTFHSEKLYPTW